MKSRKLKHKWSAVTEEELSHYVDYESVCSKLVEQIQKEVDEEFLSVLFDIARVTINGKKYILNSYRGIVDNSDNLEYINIICELNKKL